MALPPNIVWRDHVRYTGDGLPNEPVGKPAPIGDETSGIHNPKKPEIRDWGYGIQVQADRAEAAADLLEQVTDAIDAISGPADARKRFVVNATGTGYTLAPRAKHLSVAYSQSNFANRGESATWILPPPPNLFVWNGGNWSGDITPPLGNAFVPASTRDPQIPLAYAAELARENPETDFYVIIIARGGTGIRALSGIRYRFRTATTGAPASGDVRFNGSNSVIAYNETDLTNYIRFLGDTDLGTSAFYDARIQTTAGGTSWANFSVNSPFVDAGTYRTQNIAFTGSANWPPADGTDVTIFPTAPRMRDVFNAIIPAAMTAMGLTGTARKIDKLLIWPTEGDTNYYGAYAGSDFDFILAFLAAYLRPDTQILMTLPWPYATGISATRAQWWHAIRAIAARDTDMRTLIALDKTGADNWTDTNKVHVAEASMEMLGAFMRKSERTGGTVNPIADNGAYTPAITGVANTSTITPSEAMWFRVGAIVTVSGIVSILPVANATTTVVRIPLPIPSDLFGHFLAGQAVAGNVANNCGQIQGDPATDTATLQYTAAGVNAASMAYTFSYRIREA